MMTFEGLRRHLVGMVGSDNVWTNDVRLAAHHRQASTQTGCAA